MTLPTWSIQARTAWAELKRAREADELLEAAAAEYRLNRALERGAILLRFGRAGVSEEQAAA